MDDIEPSQPDSGKDAQPPAEYMDLIEAGKNGRKAESAGPVPDYAHLHPSTRSWEVLRHHVTIEKLTLNIFLGNGNWSRFRFCSALCYLISRVVI